MTCCCDGINWKVSEVCPRHGIRAVWINWLARNGYGIDFNFTEDPPCSLRELAEAYDQMEPGEGVDSWEWCITQETGAFS